MRHDISRRDLLAAAGRGVLVAPFLTLAACGPGTEPRRTIELRGRTMGTTYRLLVRPAPGGIDTLALHTRAAQIFRAADTRLSAWRSDSELTRINAAAPGRWVEVSPSTVRVVAAARAMHAASGGAFDPTLGPLVDAWGFGPTRAPYAVPSEELLVRLRRGVDAAAVEVRAQPPAVRRLRADVRLDLSGIAQGYALEAVAARLTQEGVEHALLELGGELRSIGRATDARPWRVAVERPHPGGREPLCVVELEDAAIGTSGVYLTSFEAGGRRYGHVLDPRTGCPVAHDLLSVSVIAADAMQADALATALLVLGPGHGLALAQERGLAALFAQQDGEQVRILTTPAFARRVVADGERT